MSKKLYSITVTGDTKTYSFDTYVDPRYIDEYRAEGIDIDEIVNTIPQWVVDIGMLKPWVFMQDIFNFKNPFKG